MKGKFNFVVGMLLLFVCMNLVGCTLSDNAVGKDTPAQDDFVELNDATALNAYIVSSDVEAPGKEDVLSMRKTVLEGMTEEEIERLKENIKVANQTMEKAYLYDDLFGKLSESSNLYWNYVDQKGEIQIGWALENVTDYDASSGLTYEEYAQKYGEPIMEYNRFDADNFIELMKEMRDSLKADFLKEDFDCLIQNMQLAKETHDVKYMEEIYYILHDMDYFLLRYGIEDVGKYLDDVSTVSKYYGALKVYEEFQQIVDSAEPIEDTFYDKDEYGYIEAKAQSYTNFQGQECGYADFDCYYFVDEANQGKYDLVNQTLQKLYDEKETEYQAYCEEYLYDYEADDESITFYLYLVSIPYVGEDYVSLIFNDIVSYVGAAHPATYFVPVTIRVETGEIVTPEEVLDKSWTEICTTVGMNERNEEEFMEEYGFYLTDHTLTYKYRTNIFVDEIVIKR